MSSSSWPGPYRVSQALVDFVVDSKFPEEEVVIGANIESSALPVALELLSNAKASLENEIRETSHEEAPNVDAWIANAKTLQEDIESSRRLANDIIRQAEADGQREEDLNDQEKHLTFLEDEVAFNKQLRESLLLIQEVQECLETAETLVNSRQILDALHLLDKAWNFIAKIPTNRLAQAVRLLDAKCFDLRQSANDLLRSIWENLIVVNHDGQEITINKELDGEATNIDAALVSTKAYKQLEKEAKQFWENLDDVILNARTDLSQPVLRSIHIEGNSIRLTDETVDSTIKSLFLTIEKVIIFLVEKLPPDFIKPLSDAMMPDLSTRLKEEWLDAAVPTSLDDMAEYQKCLAQVQEFVQTLRELSWPGYDIFEDWIAEAPKIWIAKKRETSLDWTRNQLGFGVGMPQKAEHFERHLVERDEGKQIASTGNMVTQDWDAAWETEEDGLLPPGTNRASLDEARRASEVFSPTLTTPTIQTPAVNEDDEAADAWGWGDEEAADEPISEDVIEPPSMRDGPSHPRITPDTREVTLSESYKTSSMPQPVFNTITGIINDGARLTSTAFEHVPVTQAAPALFSLPTLILAMYRSVSPYYYSQHQSGNMFTYNDSIWLCDKMEEFQSEWNKRTDLTPRAYGKVKLDPEIKKTRSFGKRAYTNELNAQRTVNNDLLGGSQNFFQQDGSLKGELESDINIVVKHIRKVAASWKPILAYSAWASSVGSLVNSVASKIIADVFDLNDVSVDEAERIATLISSVIELDDLFLPPVDPKSQTHRNNGTNGEDEPIPMTAQFADKWMKLKFLSEVLQSNLSDIKYFWFESDLSIYFSADEVVDLIGLSFENNANVRQAVKEIKESQRVRPQ